MPRTTPRNRPVFGLAALLLAAGLPCAVLARQDAGGEKPEDRIELDAMGRRVSNHKTTTLAFKNVTLDQVVPFLVEATGKVVLPQQEVMSRKITILNDKPIPQGVALDMVILALQQSGVSVVETPDLILLRDIAEIDRQDVPVIGPDESVLGRTDLGTIAEKVYTFRNGSAANMETALKDSIPDYANLFVDKDSNQVVVRGNIGLLQRFERLVNSLDRPGSAALTTETFRLRYADADQVATNIRDLFEQNRGQTQQGGGQNRGPFFGGFPGFGQGGFGGGGFGGGGQGGGQGGGGRQGGGGGQGQGGGGGGRQGGPQAGEAASAVSTSSNLRVTSNRQQNSVTVLAEKAILEQIRKQIAEVWDQPLPTEAVIPKIYDLRNSDPVKVKDLLVGLFGQPSSTASAQTSQGVGRLAGQFSFEAIPEAGRLVVVAKSPDNLFVIDQIIEGIDQPQTAGLPRIVELKHANSEELAEQLNALLAQEGTLASVQRSESGLSQQAASVSPFASQQQTTTGAQDTGTNAAATNASNITFWWQRARPPTDSRGASNLVSKIRIVPVWRQNAVMVLSPPEYQASVVSLIQDLDRPGRQVLISAVVAEISLDDATALGLRVSSQTLTPTNPDNSISIGSSSENTKNNFLPGLFDTSVLNVNADLNLLFQALSQKTSINILSEPKIFTSDNQEAEFFDGQDIPFITDSQVNQQGNLVQSFDYRAVGIVLRIRPRITINRDVDLRVNLQLSSIQPQQTLFGGFIVDRRETTTQLIVRDGQTIVISGILRSEDSDIKRKVPLLGDIPLLGALFTNIEKTKTNTELVAFITPFVVDNPERLDEINDPFRRRLGELRQELGQPAEEPEPTVPVPPAPGAPTRTEPSGEAPAPGEPPPSRELPGVG